MKALTILEPWASLIALGEKKIETRSWPTQYRGPIAIHAGKSMEAWHMNYAWKEPYFSALKELHVLYPDGKKGIRYNCGSVIAIADLIDCAKIIRFIDNPNVAKLNGIKKLIRGNEFWFGDYTPGRYAWILDNVRRIDPVPAKGKQRLWEWEGK